MDISFIKYRIKKRSHNDYALSEEMSVYVLFFQMYGFYIFLFCWFAMLKNGYRHPGALKNQQNVTIKSTKCTMITWLGVWAVMLAP